MMRCKHCGEEFDVTEQETELAAKLRVPVIAQCHTCRRKRRMTWRNEIVLYNRSCDLCKKDIVATYAKDAPFPVYCEDCWWGDKWNATQFALDYREGVSFFEQFKALLQQVPRPALTVSNNVDCAYVNFVNYSKGSYFTFGCKEADDCLYAWRTEHCKNCVDSSQLTECEYCYEAVDCEKCYNVHFSKNASNCNDGAFLLNCVSCSNCFGCVNLVRQSYCIFNKQYSKKDYEEKMKEYDLRSFERVQELQKQFAEFSLQFPRKFSNITNSEDSSGDTLSYCKNANHCFSIYKANNAYDVYSGEDITDALSCDIAGWPGELLYNNISGCVNAYDVKCCSTCWSCTNAEYSDNCHNSDNIFGCIGLRKNRHCILNKQYSKKEYEALKEKIISELAASGEYGFFFPTSVCPYAYNESVAQDYFPLTKDGAEKEGFMWKEDVGGTKGRETISPEELPDSIDDVPDSITNEILACTNCRKNYKIITQELAFYRKHGFPLPRKCPVCRIRERLHSKNPIQLWHRQCMCTLPGHTHHTANQLCGNEFETPYAPERPEKVFCELCYQKEVF